MTHEEIETILEEETATQQQLNDQLIESHEIQSQSSFSSLEW